MIVYPAIDLKNGQCVRLVQGKAEDKTVYADEPALVAENFQSLGAEWLHVVDLDGAFTGKPANLDAIKSITQVLRIPFQVGGGLRTKQDVEEILALGAARVIIGTGAVGNTEFVEGLLREYGPERIILGLDARDGMAAVRGWVETSAVPAVELGVSMRQLGFKSAVFTDISRDGVLTGPNLLFIEEIARGTGLEIIASGGVSGINDIEQLKILEVYGVQGVIIGKAIYEGKIDLKAAITAAGPQQ